MQSIFSDKSFSEERKEEEEKRLKKLYEAFPEFETGRYENNPYVWGGRAAVMITDPVYWLMPWTRAAQAGKLLGRGGVEHTIGASDSGGDPFDGYMSDIYFIDGQQLHCGNFAMPNPDNTNIWIPKPYRGTFGSNGYHLEFKQSGTSQNASGIGADTSGNDNHLAVNNLAATDVTVDTPTNNFCTLNFNHKSTANVLLSEGNLKAVLNQTSGWQHAAGTIAVKNGKWYWEAKALAVAATDKTSIGVLQFDTTDVDFINNTNTDRSSKGISGHGAGTGSYSYAEGDIIQCAMDLDNKGILKKYNVELIGANREAIETAESREMFKQAMLEIGLDFGIVLARDFNEFDTKKNKYWARCLTHRGSQQNTNCSNA